MFVKNIGALLLELILLFSLQVFFLQNFSVGEFAFCFVYIQLLILAPLEIGGMVFMLIAFFLGLGIDLFYDTLGIHAAASVLTAYSRKYSLRLLEPGNGYENADFSIRDLGPAWFFAYVSIGVFVHTFALLLLEASNFSFFFSTLGKTLASTLLTVAVIGLLQLLTGKAFKKSSRSGSSFE